MLVVLDANAIVANPFQSGSYWRALEDAVDSEAVHLYIPELALREAVAVYQRNSKQQIADIRARAKRAPHGVSDALIIAANEWDRVCADYDRDLRERLSYAHILPVPAVNHSQLAQRAIDHVAPFDNSGSGYRDALHWFAAIELFASTYPEEDSPGTRAFFVSNDQAAFGPNRRTPLAAEIANASEWEVEFVDRVDQIEIPGLFTGEKADSGSLDDPGVFTHALDEAVYTFPLRSRNFDASKYDVIKISKVNNITVVEDSAEVFFVSKELLIEFRVEVLCEVRFERMDNLYGGRDELVTSRSTWKLIFDGTCTSENNRRSVAAPDLELIDEQFLQTL